MKFRKLYWVTEQVGQDGSSEVVAVFTSIFDLRNKGLRWDAEIDRKAALRVSLVKLDSSRKPFGTWQSPDFAGMREALDPFVESGEFDGPSCDQLVEDLKNFCAAPAG